MLAPLLFPGDVEKGRVISIPGDPVDDADALGPISKASEQSFSSRIRTYPEKIEQLAGIEARGIARVYLGSQAAWDDWSKPPNSITALAAFLIEWVGANLLKAQVWYVGPLAKEVGDYGADVSDTIKRLDEADWRI
ncbi:MAG: hypothetical protein M1827_003793 [Pycnora praestabilis]|nr:MAG: hypothetical protein M1827_003793 [Pycnora praestabilis]